MLYAHYHLPKPFEDHTWKEVNELMSQIPQVSSMFMLKEIVTAFLSEDYKGGSEFEEYESKEDKKQVELLRIQSECEKRGIKPPERLA